MIENENLKLCETENQVLKQKLKEVEEGLKNEQDLNAALRQTIEELNLKIEKHHQSFGKLNQIYMFDFLIVIKNVFFFFSFFKGPEVKSKFLQLSLNFIELFGDESTKQK